MNNKLAWFYKQKQWQLCRDLVITNYQGKCGHCQAVGEEVHHIIQLTASNVNDVDISLNPSNLILLCKQCHNKQHNRFKSSCLKFDSIGNPIAPTTPPLVAKSQPKKEPSAGHLKNTV